VTPPALIPAGGALAEATAGGHLELVSEFEVKPGGHVNPHRHPTHEFYLVRSGRGLMTVGDASWEIVPGDLVTIPSEVVHSLEPVAEEPIRCFCFAVADAGAAPVDYGSDGADEGAGGEAGEAAAGASVPGDAATAAPPAAAPEAGLAALDVRTPRAIEPALEHRGTVAVWWTVPPRELRAATLGGRLGEVRARELTAAGAPLMVPAAPALRIYAVGAGEGSIEVDGERRPLRPDDVALVGPGRAHAIEGELSFLSVAYELNGEETA
jgi:mannose-6-phosphate isomerase-like protein (cupin superfamily)